MILILFLDAGASATEVEKPVIAQLEHNSATFRRMIWGLVAIQGKIQKKNICSAIHNFIFAAMVPLTVPLILSLVLALLKLAVLGTSTSVRWMDAVKTLTPLAHIEKTSYQQDRLIECIFLFSSLN